MKSIFTLLFISFSFGLISQTTSDFEDFNIEVDTFLNGVDGNGGFSNGNIFLPNSFSGGFWSGWAISSTTDVTTPGPANQYSAITGRGFDNSSTYAVGGIFSPTIMELTGSAEGGLVDGFYITNSTYAFWSLVLGDNFAKKFGGETGNDPDFFLLTIEKYLDGEKGPQKVEFYLADYRFEDNTQDYIISDWTYIDLKPLANADSLVFTLSSSDVGDFGMNTPAYFCMDNLITADMVTNTNELLAVNYSIYPNPASDYLVIDWKENQTAKMNIFNMNGQFIKSVLIDSDQQQINIKEFSVGSYVIEIEYENKKQTQVFIKQ